MNDTRHPHTSSEQAGDAKDLSNAQVMAQMSVSSNLRLLSCLVPLRRGAGPRKNNRTSVIINWLALYFARNDCGEASAAAVQCEPGQITLHVALNGAPTAFDRAASDHLMSTLRAIFSPNQTSGSQMTALLRLISRKASFRIRRRLLKLVDTDWYQDASVSALGLCGMFEQVLSAWVSQEKKAALRNEHGNPEGGIGILKTSFARLVSNVQQALLIADTDADPNAWFSVLQKIWADLAILHDSEVIRAFEKASVIISRFYGVMSRLCRRMWRIYCYYIGAARFVSDGIPLFSLTLGKDGIEDFIRGGGGVSISWVFDQLSHFKAPGKPIHLPTTPAIYLNDVIESCALRSRYRPGIRALLQEDEIIKTAWSTDELIIPRIHPEMQLATFLLQGNVKILGDCVGISKPVCWSCECAIQPLVVGTKSLDKSRWKVAELSGKFKDDWMPPPTATGTEKIVNDIAHRLAAAIAQRLDPLLWIIDNMGVAQYCDEHYDRCPQLYPVPSRRADDVFQALLSHGSLTCG